MEKKNIPSVKKNYICVFQKTMTDQPEEFTVTELLPEEPAAKRVPAEEEEQDCVRILDSRYRAWCFTYNNYTKEVMKVIDEEVAPDAQYLVYGEEVAPTTGTPHLQGYMYFKSARKGSALKKTIGPNIRLSKARASAEKNREYCTKDGKFHEFGTIPKQGERSDLKDLVGSLSASHKSIEELALVNPQAYHQYGRTLHFIHGIKLREQKRDFMTLGYWLYGKSGVGKSHQAVAQCAEGNYTVYEYEYHKNGWWNNYRGEQAVIFHEFDERTMTYEQLKRMVDKYPFSVPQTNVGTVPFMSLVVIICSDRPPWDIFKDESVESMEQIFRRFEIFHFVGRQQHKKILYRDYVNYKDDELPDANYTFTEICWPGKNGKITAEDHSHPQDRFTSTKSIVCWKAAGCQDFARTKVSTGPDGGGLSSD